MRYTHFDMLPEKAFQPVGKRMTLEGGGGITKPLSTAASIGMGQSPIGAFGSTLGSQVIGDAFGGGGGGNAGGAGGNLGGFPGIGTQNQTQIFGPFAGVNPASPAYNIMQDNRFGLSPQAIQPAQPDPYLQQLGVNMNPQPDPYMAQLGISTYPQQSAQPTQQPGSLGGAVQQSGMPPRQVNPGKPMVNPGRPLANPGKPANAPSYLQQLGVNTSPQPNRYLQQLGVRQTQPMGGLGGLASFQRGRR